MKRICASMTAALLLCGAAGSAETTATCDQGLTAPLRAREILLIDSSAAGITIVGTGSETLRITCTTEGDPQDVRLRLSGDSGHDQLRITSGAANRNNLQIRVEVPHRTSLRLHMGAGQVTVNNLEGDKYIDLYAGQINIAAGDTTDYSSVDASVDIGEVNASAWGVDKGGFFRSFRHTTANGEYRLVAHVLTGEIDLQ